MNTGVISSRYAKALLKLVLETGGGENVYAQVTALLADPDRIPQPLAPELERFIALLVKNHRIEHVKLMFNSFVKMYDEQVNRRRIRLTTALAAPELERKIKVLFEEKLGGEVIIDAKVDPDIIGGFILVVDDRMLDASVSRQIEDIRRQFIEKNKRIV